MWAVVVTSTSTARCGPHHGQPPPPRSGKVPPNQSTKGHTGNMSAKGLRSRFFLLLFGG